MIIENRRAYIALSVLFFLSGCLMNKEPQFTVSGDKDILEKLIINIKTTSDEKGFDEHLMQTFLYEGEIFPLKLDDPKVIHYEMFASFNGELVGKSARYDNAMRFYPQDQVNHIEINESSNGAINIFHVIDKKSLSFNFNIIKPNIAALRSDKTFDNFIQDQNIEKDSNEYLFFKDAFFKNFREK